MIELCFYENVKMLIKYAEKTMCSEIVVFPFDLSFGDISDIYNTEIKNDIYNSTGNSIMFKKPKEYINAFIRLKKSKEAVRIWTSKFPAEYCGMIWAVSELGDRDIYIAECTDADKLSEEACRKVGDMSMFELRKLSEGKRILSEAEKLSYKEQFMKVQKENAGLRILENGELKSYPIEHYDRQIIALIPKEEYISFPELLEMLNKEIIQSNYFFKYRIDELKKIDKIKVLGDEENWNKIMIKKI